VETEKVCVNLPAAELGKIDVLIAEGLFASRTDLIRSGIRTILDAHDETVRRVARTEARIGYQLLMQSELQAARLQRQKIRVFVVGVLRIQSTVTPDLADETIEKIRIFGSVKGPADVLARIDDRIIRGGENLEF
jgi:Arc/MetJ-type ribon-helix-helix transcriptional regulator